MTQGVPLERFIRSVSRLYTWYIGVHMGFRLWGLGFRGMWGQGMGFKDTTL